MTALVTIRGTNPLSGEDDGQGQLTALLARSACVASRSVAVGAASADDGGAERRKRQLCFSCHGLRRPPRQRPASRPLSDACKWVNAGEWAWGVALERSKEGHVEASATGGSGDDDDDAVMR